MNKKITPNEFRHKIKTVNNIAVTGFRWSGTPQLLLRLIREEFDESGLPNNLTIMFTSSATDPGLDHLAHPDLLKCSYGSYYGSIPKIRKLVQENKIEGYSLPQGQLSLLFREIGRGSPGLISTVGKYTYIDPKNGGGKLNKKTKCTTIMGEHTPSDTVDIKVKHDEIIKLDNLQIKAIYTPGHTSDSYSFLMNNYLFSGDTLLINGTGRTDFQNGNSRDAYESIFNKLLILPFKTIHKTPNNDRKMPINCK